MKIKKIHNAQNQVVYIVSNDNNKYAVLLPRFGNFSNDLTIKVGRIEQSGIFVKRDKLVPLAEFHYDNRNDIRIPDYQLMFRALQKKECFRKIENWYEPKQIALIFAYALGVNDQIALSIIESFDQVSWDMKVEALIALNDMRLEYEKRMQQDKQHSQDKIMKQKLAALEQYNKIMNDLDTITKS